MFLATRDCEEAADTVENKQLFVVVNPDTLEGGLSGPAYEKLHVKIVQLGVIKKQNICDKSAII